MSAGVPVVQATDVSQQLPSLCADARLVKELTEVLQRQKTRVAALQKDRAEQAAQLGILPGR